MMNIPRISFKHFVFSRFFAWSIVAILLTAGGFGGHQYTKTVEELSAAKTEVKELRTRTERLTHEIAQAEWALSQERKRNIATETETIEERPDGSTVISRSKTVENEDTNTESSGSERREKDTREVEVAEESTTTQETEQRKIESETGSSNRYAVGGGVELRGLDERPKLYISGEKVVLGPVRGEVRVEVDGTTYEFEGLSIGIEVEL